MSGQPPVHLFCYWCRSVLKHKWNCTLNQTAAGQASPYPILATVDWVAAIDAPARPLATNLALRTATICSCDANRSSVVIDSHSLFMTRPTIMSC